MWTRTLLTGAAALAALVIAAGCSNNSGGQQPSGQTTTAASPTAQATTPAGEAHNQADVMFAQHMIPHHQQAIEMSDMLLSKQGIDPRVIELANQIKAAQGPEIEQMQGVAHPMGQPTQMPMSRESGTCRATAICRCRPGTCLAKAACRLPRARRVCRECPVCRACRVCRA